MEETKMLLKVMSFKFRDGDSGGIVVMGDHGKLVEVYDEDGVSVPVAGVDKRAMSIRQHLGNMKLEDVPAYVKRVCGGGVAVLEQEAVEEIENEAEDTPEPVTEPGPVDDSGEKLATFSNDIADDEETDPSYEEVKLAEVSEVESDAVDESAAEEDEDGEESDEPVA